jgi:hypothetical protein
MLEWLRRRRSTEAPPPAPPLAPASASGLAPRPPEAERTPEELLVEAMERLRRDLRDIESRSYRHARASVADGEARIAHARQMLKDTGLDVALPCILQEVWHWGSWLNNPKLNWQGHLAFDLYDLAAAPVRTDTSSGVRVDYRLAPGGGRYRFEWEKDERPSYVPDSSNQYGVIRFHADEAHVLTVDMVHDLERAREYWEWKTLTPTVMEPGPWIAGVLEFEHRIRMAKQREQLKWQASYIREKSTGLPPVPNP